ncbi:MAG: 2-amino-4-hydroxy-6-hydroxymethyldihydropteridine diphosphokinase [Anaerolineae bacterium]|nr:2-amino-4-hydroxy-6-hydroxymethyldihydropteridine diphosphokinase [Anaerolineae bacterium]
MHRVVILLGSNIDKERNLPAAVRLLRQAIEVAAVSPVYETAAVPDDRPRFLNAAVLLLTEQTAAALKDGLLGDIERALGRERAPDRNAPRTIDLDIALYDDDVFDYTPADGRTRHVPEPDLMRFPHCLQPVADLLPDLPHPETGEPLGELAARVLRDYTARHGPVLWPRPDIVL